ncbi:CheW protein [Paramagnetospirillum caucaseum]|uniref:CheW protein n=1 Tax=Paramagnetospirillum caucaseum TaxID=1244869 RepID=M2ZQF5_9PROT|nr:chemotaxis protein CheW [Paramagnetospirillum caucaseum]EME69552.1 CheW protein [Paramagnetospirillum caucaseum]
MGNVHTLSRPVEILTLALSGEAFALEATIVREILDLVPITTVPNAPRYATGLINVRGKVVPLVDLRVRLGMTVEPRTIDTRIVVIEATLDGELTMVGLLADKVYEVAEINMQSIESTPKVGMRWPPEFIRGIGRRNGGFLIILDIDRVFASEPAREDRLHGS